MNDVKQESGGYTLLIVVVAAVFAFTSLGALAARLGGSYRLVRVASLPAPVFLSNLLLMPMLLFFALVYGVVTGDKAPLQGALGSLLDPSANPGTFLALQAIAWLTCGARMSRFVTISLMDWSTACWAKDKGVHPATMRADRASGDLPLLRESLRYATRGDAPSLGVALVCLEGVSAEVFYGPSSPSAP